MIRNQIILLICLVLIPYSLPAKDHPNDSTGAGTSIKFKKEADSLALEKSKAEIALLKKSISSSETDSALIIAIAGAVLSIISGMISGVMAARKEGRLEMEKWQRQRSDSFESEFRNTLKELAISMACAFHSMCWLCWLARFGPERLTAKKIEEYDIEMHTLLPKIEGIYSIIAGMDYKVYLKIRPLVHSVMQLDAKIGQAGLKFTEDKPETAEALAEFYEESVTLENSIATTVAEAIQQYSVKA